MTGRGEEEAAGRMYKKKNFGSIMGQKRFRRNIQQYLSESEKLSIRRIRVFSIKISKVR